MTTSRDEYEAGSVTGHVSRAPLTRALAVHDAPVFDVKAFEDAGVFESDEEVDEFIAEVRRWRNEGI